MNFNAMIVIDHYAKRMVWNWTPLFYAKKLHVGNALAQYATIVL
jgi:hypothetical protein